MSGPAPAALRVLLFSPVAGRDPSSGDTSYTEALLADPPAGVVYTSYSQAIEQGDVEVLGRKPWGSGGRIRDLPWFAVRSLELGIRRVGAAFREPWWYVRINPLAFDLVHSHLFGLKQVGTRLPIVSSAGYPLTQLYEHREKWSAGRIAYSLWLEEMGARLLDVHEPWLRPSSGGLMTVYGERFRQWLITRGIASDDVTVAGTFLPDLKLPRVKRTGKTLAFIGRDFTRKGGHLAIRSLEILRATDPAWRLIVVTDSSVPESVCVRPGVELHRSAPREEVLTRFLPHTDVLLLPTSSDCGAPYGVLEALQSGCGIVTSLNPWLDERLNGPAVRRVALIPDAIVKGVESVLAQPLHDLQCAARELWATQFAPPSVQARLLREYRRAFSRQAL